MREAQLDGKVEEEERGRGRWGSIRKGKRSGRSFSPNRKLRRAGLLKSLSIAGIRQKNKAELGHGLLDDNDLQELSKERDLHASLPAIGFQDSASTASSFATGETPPERRSSTRSERRLPPSDPRNALARKKKSVRRGSNSGSVTNFPSGGSQGTDPSAEAAESGRRRSSKSKVESGRRGSSSGSVTNLPPVGSQSTDPSAEAAEEAARRRKSKVEKILKLQEVNKDLKKSTMEMQRDLAAKEDRIKELEQQGGGGNQDEKHVEALMKLTAATKRQQESIVAQQEKYEKVKRDSIKAQKEAKRLKKEKAAKEEHIKQFEQEIDSNISEISELRKELSTALQQIESLNEENERERTKILKLTKELSLAGASSRNASPEMKAQLKEFEDEIARKKQELESERALNDNQAEQIEELQQDLKASEALVRELEQDRDRSLALLDKANEKLMKDLEEKSILFQEAQKEKLSMQQIEESQQKLSAALNEAREELEQMRQEKEDALEADERINFAVKDLEEERARLMQNVESITFELEDAKQLNETLEAESDAVRNELENELQKLRDSQEELQKALHEANTSSRERGEDDAGQTAEQNLELDSLRCRNKELTRALETIEEERDAWKAATEAAKMKAARASEESEQLQENLNEETNELRTVNAEMEGEIHLLMEERDTWKRQAEKAETEAAVARENSGDSGDEDVQELRVANRLMKNDIKRLEEERDSWKKAAESNQLNGSNHSSSDDNLSMATDNTALQASFLQAAAERQKHKDSGARPNRWLNRMGRSYRRQSSKNMSAGSDSDNEKDLVEELQKTNSEKDDTIANLRSEIVRLNSSYKEEAYLNKKKIETLTTENIAYQTQVKALEFEFDKMDMHDAAQNGF